MTSRRPGEWRGYPLPEHAGNVQQPLAIVAVEDPVRLADRSGGEACHQGRVVLHWAHERITWHVQAPDVRAFVCSTGSKLGQVGRNVDGLHGINRGPEGSVRGAARDIDPLTEMGVTEPRGAEVGVWSCARYRYTDGGGANGACDGEVSVRLGKIGRRWWQALMADARSWRHPSPIPLVYIESLLDVFGTSREDLGAILVSTLSPPCSL